MNRAKRQNPMLMEMLIVLLFFALSACILLGVYAAAYSGGETALSQSEALLWAEDLIERFCASGQGAAGFLEENGFAQTENGYALTRAFSKTEYAFCARVRAQAYETGVLHGFALTAEAGGRDAFSLPAANFVWTGGQTP